MTCNYCTAEVYVRCRKHRQYLCGSGECVERHRDFHSVGALGEVIPAAWGDCEFVAAQHPLTGWLGHVISLIVALAVGSLLVLIVRP